MSDKRHAKKKVGFASEPEEVELLDVETEGLVSMLSEQDKHRLRKIFDKADLDHNGSLCQREVIGLLHRLNLWSSGCDPMAVMKTIDADGDDRIEFDEFLSAIERAQMHMMRDNQGGAADFNLEVPKKVGYGGTTWRHIGNLTYLTNCAMIIVAAACLISGLTQFQFILVPTCMAYFLTFLFDPLINMLHQRPCICRKRVMCSDQNGNHTEDHCAARCCRCFALPRIVAVIVAVVIGFLVLGVVGWGVSWTVTKEFEDPAFQAQLTTGAENMVVYLNTSYNMELQELNDFLKFSGNETQVEASIVYTFDDLSAKVGEYSMILTTVNDAMVTLLLLVYILAAKEEKTSGTVVASENKKSYEMSLGDKLNKQLSFYIVIKTQISLITGVLVGLGLYMCSVRLSAVFGVLAFLLNYVPNVGSFIAGILPWPLIYIDESLSVVQKIFAVVLPALIEFAVGNVVEPVVFGKALNLTTVSVLAALVIWYGMWGLPGAVLSVPLLSAMKCILDEADHPVAKMFLHVIREHAEVDETHVIHHANSMWLMQLLPSNKRFNLRTTRRREASRGGQEALYRRVGQDATPDKLMGGGPVKAAIRV